MKGLPKVGITHLQEKNSIQQLGNLLPNNLFILRSEDGGDYGVDRIIEVIQDGNATNIRSHIQIKSTGKQTNKSGKITYPVPIKTLNYLLNSLNSIFLVYSEKDVLFYWEWAGVIALKRKKSNSKSEKSFSYTFSSILGTQILKKIHAQLFNDSELIKRINLTANPFEKVIITEQIHEDSYRDYLVMYTEGKYEKIIALSKETGVASPEHNSLISLCYYSIYNYEEALKYIIKAEQQEDNDEFQKIKVAILCEKGLIENSKETLEQAKKLFLERKSNNWRWMDLYNYGNVLTGLEDYKEAEDCYKKAIKLEPNEAMIWKNLSNIYKHQEQFDKEIECLDVALTMNENLIEALICKGLSLGNNYSKFSEAIVLLEKALMLSKSTMYKNNAIYYWISCFCNSLMQYEKSLLIIEEGLQYHPGDKYLERNKLHTLIIASENNSHYENEAVQKLQNVCERYPDEICVKIELVKILGRRQSINQILPLITECFSFYKYDLEPELILSMHLNQIVYMLQNMKIISEFRMKNNIGSYFFKEYNIGIAKVQKMEMRMNLLFISLYSKIKDARESDLFSLIENHAKDFLELNEYITEFIVADLKDGTVEEKSSRITHIITTLPEILLIELSRQNGWLLQKYDYSIEIADRIIEDSVFLKDWFNLCLEPILKGANNILKWSKE